MRPRFDPLVKKQHRTLGRGAYRSTVLVLACLGLVRCGHVTSATSTTAPRVVAVTATATAAPTSSPTPTPTTAAPPINLHPQVEVLASDLPEPDDLLLAPGGSILISDVNEGTIRQLTPDGQMHLVISGLNEPEGMALASDGSLIIAEQAITACFATIRPPELSAPSWSLSTTRAIWASITSFGWARIL